MLGTLLRSSFKQFNRLPQFAIIPKYGFASTSAKVKNQPVPENPDNLIDVDPRIQELSQHVPHFNFQKEGRLFKNCSFENDMLPALNVYKQLRFRQGDLLFLMRRKPSLLRLYTNEDKNDIAKLSNYLTEKYNMNSKQFRCCLLRNPWLINYSNEGLQQRIDFVQKALQLTNVSF